MSDLTSGEKRLIKALNLEHNKNYKPNSMMEWSTSVLVAQKGETLYFISEFGVFMAMKD